MSFVLDASVALAWCFEDEQTAYAMDVLDRVTETGATAPLLWPLEVLNGLLMAERRGRLDAGRRATLGSSLRALPIVLDGDLAEQAWDASIRLAEQFRLTIYDAAYLELAHRRRLPLASLDQALKRAATSLGVEQVGAAV